MRGGHWSRSAKRFGQAVLVHARSSRRVPSVVPAERARPVFVSLTATGDAEDVFILDDEDAARPVVRRRVHAAKPVHLSAATDKTMPAALVRQFQDHLAGRDPTSAGARSSGRGASVPGTPGAALASSACRPCGLRLAAAGPAGQLVAAVIHALRCPGLSPRSARPRRWTSGCCYWAGPGRPVSPGAEVKSRPT